MKLNLKSLDATIDKLQKLRELANDPDLAPFISGGRSLPSNGHAKPVSETPLGQAILEAMADMSGKEYTVANVHEGLGKANYKFNGDEPKKSIGNTLRGLVAEGLLKIKVQGKGRRASVYEF